MTKKWLTNTCKPLKHNPHNCQTERSRMSIPEAPNRQANYLIEVVSVCIPIVFVQVAVPCTVSIVLRRTPPVTVVANVVVICKEVAVPARKTSK